VSFRRNVVILILPLNVLEKNWKCEELDGKYLLALLLFLFLAFV